MHNFIYKSFITLIVFCCCYSARGVENNSNATYYKPQINNNTPTRIEYGCQRPDWGTYEYFTPYNNEIIKCYFNTRNVVLYNTSKVQPKIDVKPCKKNKQQKMCCKVLSGEWHLKNGDDVVIITEPKKIQIDHILPYSYLRLNMKDCKLRHKYFNYLQNLTPELADVNLKKSNYLCQSTDECKKQKEICEAISIEFNDEHLCDDINKINPDKNDVKKID